MPSRRQIQSIYDRSILAPEYQKALQHPKPELGWTGDPDLRLAWNRLEDRYEIWREEVFFDHSTGKWETTFVIIGRAPHGERLDINAMIRGLVARDTKIACQSHRKAMDDYFRRLDAEERQRESEAIEALTPVHEKLAWAIAKDEGELSPFVSFS